MVHYQFIVLICAGIVTILGATTIIMGAFMKKSSSEIKIPCAERFTGFRTDLTKLENNAKERSDRVLILETRYAEIVSRLTRLEQIMDKNAIQTDWIYAYMTEQKKHGKK